MPLSEPVTTLTDYLLAAASFGFAVSMARRIGPHNRVSAWFWCAAFLSSAAAAAVGGTNHGFANTLGEGTRQTLWNLVVFAMGACAAFVTAAVHAAHIVRDNTLRLLVAGVAVTLLGAAVQQSGFPRMAAFNHNDAYHLIQLAAFYLLFRAAQKTEDRRLKTED